MNALKSKRKQEKREQLEGMKENYAIYRNVAHSMMCFATCVVIAELERRNLSAAYIKRMFENICLIADAPEIGKAKRPSMVDVMHEQERKYGIDYNDLRIHIETEKEFIKACKEG